MNTKKYIETTLIGLLKRKSIDRIKVNEIIREVGTCKGTFYKYYKDKYELLVSCFNSNFYSEIIASTDSWDDFLYKCLAKFEKEPAVILNSFNSTDVNSVRYYHEELISSYLENSLGQADSHSVNKLNKFATKMCATNYTDIILRWLSDGMEESKEDLIMYMKAALPQAIYPVKEKEAAV